MQRRIHWYLMSFVILATSSLRGADGWAQLKVGMSSDEATEALGLPLMKTSARGFDLWIYDHNAEVLFFGGPLVGWTTPCDLKVASLTVDVWQRPPGSTKPPSFILPRFTKRVERRRDVNLDSNSASSLYKVSN